jgi:DNA-binding NtrC family response regulator
LKDRILIVDDETPSRELCRAVLLRADREIVLAPHAEAALEELACDHFDLVVTDMIMPKLSGLDLLEKIKSERSDLSVILMSGKGTIAIAVKAIQLGADEFIEKPFSDPEILNIAVERVLRARKLERENRELKRELANLRDREVIIGGEAISNVFRTVEKIAPLDATVLITGETGVGKEIIAKRIHALSHRASRAFVAVNCGSFPEGLLESLLFGHEKGAFTGANKKSNGYLTTAEGGTLFLDEIGDMPLALQTKLLRVIQERRFRRVGGEADLNVDCRILTATHRDLPEMVKDGNFREDLFYRLNVIHLHIPPLRQRREDIPAFIGYFIKVTATRMKKSPPSIDPEAVSRLQAYPWPGNVRELQNVIERALALYSGDNLTLNDFADSITSSEPCTPPLDTIIVPYSQAKEIFEKSYLATALQQANHSVGIAAQNTGIPRQNFYLKMKKYKIRSDELV